MKKVVILSFLLSLVSCSANAYFDKLDTQLKEKFNSFEFDKFGHIYLNKFETITVWNNNDFKVFSVNTNYSFNSIYFQKIETKSTITDTYSLNYATLDKSERDVEITVRANTENFSKTYKSNCHIKNYLCYLGFMVFKSNNSMYDVIQNNDNLFTASYKTVSDGNKYEEKKFTCDLTKGRMDMSYDYYMKTLYGVTSYISSRTTYYFGNNQFPRIDGLSTGTLYITGPLGDFNNYPKEDQYAIYWVSKLNSVFKKFNEERYLTLAS